MIRKIIYGFLLATLIAPAIANAQSKPKRDTTKDRSVIVAKQKEQAKKTEAQRRRQETARKHRQRPIVNTPHYATYLFVDQQTSLTVAINSYSGNETYNVSTDGKEWSIYHLP